MSSKIDADPKIAAKFTQVMKKNEGYGKLKRISSVLSRNENIDESLEAMNLSDLTRLKDVPVVSCDVECVFSQYKNILSDNRRKFNFQHLHHHIVTKCNSDL